MIKYTHICDSCKKEEVTHSSYNPELWTRIEIKYDNTYHNNFSKFLTICPDCQKKIGLPTHQLKRLDTNEVKSLQDRLFDIVCEILDSKE